MAKKTSDRIRCAKIYDILRCESDEDNPMSAYEIMDELLNYGISSERKSVQRDLKALVDYGFGIMEKPKGKKKGYFATKDLDPWSVRFLMDATASAAFLTKKKTEEINASLASLLGDKKAEVMNKHIIRLDKLKHSNESVFANIDRFDKSIAQKKMASFDYNSFGSGGNKKCEHKIVNPLGLVFNNGYYYLCCCNASGEKRSYRIDRIVNARLEDKDNVFLNFIKDFRESETKNLLTAFSMWQGERRDVTLRIANKNIGDMYDKFGEELKVTPDGDYFKIKVGVNISPVFFGWAAGYGDELQILAPKDVKEKYIEHLERALEKNK